MMPTCKRIDYQQFSTKPNFQIFQNRERELFFGATGAILQILEALKSNNAPGTTGALSKIIKGYYLKKRCSAFATPSLLLVSVTKSATDFISSGALPMATPIPANSIIPLSL